MEITARETSGPTLERERIDSLDVLRGFALLGILVMNIQSFSMPAYASAFPDAFASLEGLNGVVWFLSTVFVDQKFMSMFSMMFGAGIALMTEHRDSANASALSVHYRRMALLGFFGMIHAYGVWYGDVLFPYAICGCFVVWARNLTPRALVTLSFLFLLVGSAVFSLLSILVSYNDSVRDYFTTAFADIDAEMQLELDAYRGNWTDHFALRFFESLGNHLIAMSLIYFWRVCGLMILGMALYKLNILTAARSTAFYIRLALVGGLVGLPASLINVYWAVASNYDSAYLIGVGSLIPYWSSLPLALMWIALVMLLCKTERFLRTKHYLRCYGRLAFTNYLGQTFLATFIFYGYGFGLFGSVSRVQQMGFVAAIWGVQLMLSSIWMRYFLIGPLEWVWRSGVYLTPQPILRRTIPIPDEQSAA